MEHCLENLKVINTEIASKLARIEELTMLKERKETEQHNKCKELADLKSKLFEIQNNQDSMRERNKVVREKLNDIDNIMKEKASTINNKQFFKMLGLKARIEDFCIDVNEIEENLLEVKFELSKSRKHHITVVYDITTEDFDLLQIEPDTPNFNDIRRFLRITRDIQGLLSSYKASLET